MLHTTVEEILVEQGAVRGVRLWDGTILEADVVISTASAPETSSPPRRPPRRGRAPGPHGALEDVPAHRTRELRRIEPLKDVPSLLVVDGLAPFEVGGVDNDSLYLRIGNDDACFAPFGHSVVQAMVPTDYDWWAKRHTGYGVAKDAVADAVLRQIERALPGLRENVYMTDVATPLTYWNMARSWRGAYEGWLPNSESFFGHVDKQLPGVPGLYMAGQWVEPGGGVPVAILSGRQVVQLMCHAEGRAFVAAPT